MMCVKYTTVEGGVNYKAEKIVELKGLGWDSVSGSYIQDVPGGKVNILGGHSIGHSKQRYLYEHVSYSERFPR